MNNVKTSVIILFALLSCISLCLIDYLLMSSFNSNLNNQSVESTDICINLRMKDGSELPEINLENKSV